MLVDESTKARYQGQENVTIFQKNLPNTIQALLKNALSKDKAEQLAHEFMTIGKHSSESWDEYIADKLSLKFNTSRVKKVKAFIKSHIPPDQKIKTAFKHGCEVRCQFYFLLDSYMPDIRKSILTDLIELKFIRSKEIKKNLQTDDFVKNIMPYAIRYIPKIENKMTYIKISNLYHKIISFCKKKQSMSRIQK